MVPRFAAKPYPLSHRLFLLVSNIYCLTTSPFDLNVLGTPPAFILSQDQTLDQTPELKLGGHQTYGLTRAHSCPVVFYRAIYLCSIYFVLVCIALFPERTLF